MIIYEAIVELILNKMGKVRRIHGFVDVHIYLFRPLFSSKIIILSWSSYDRGR